MENLFLKDKELEEIVLASRKEFARFFNIEGFMRNPHILDLNKGEMWKLIGESRWGAGHILFML